MEGVKRLGKPLEYPIIRARAMLIWGLEVARSASEELVPPTRKYVEALRVGRSSTPATSFTPSSQGE